MIVLSHSCVHLYPKTVEAATNEHVQSFNCRDKSALELACVALGNNELCARNMTGNKNALFANKTDASGSFQDF